MKAVKNAVIAISEFNVVISVVIIILWALLITNTEASVMKFSLAIIGLLVNIAKKKNTDKNDETANDNVNWLITAFVAGVLYYGFCLFC